MRAHPFDPVSAILSLVALVAGIVVIAGSTLPFEANVGPWLAVIALAFGVLLLPWSVGRRSSAAVEEGEERDLGGVGDQGVAVPECHVDGRVAVARPARRVVAEDPRDPDSRRTCAPSGRRSARTMAAPSGPTVVRSLPAWCRRAARWRTDPCEHRRRSTGCHRTGTRSPARRCEGNVLPRRNTESATALDPSRPERVRWELGNAGRRRIAERRTLFGWWHERTSQFGEVETFTARTEDRRGDVTAARTRVADVGANVRHRSAAPENLDVDLQITVGDLPDEQGVHRPEGLRGVGKRIAHRPQRDGGDDAALGQRAQIPRAVRRCAVHAVGDPLDGGGVREGTHAANRSPEVLIHRWRFPARLRPIAPWSCSLREQRATCACCHRALHAPTGQRTDTAPGRSMGILTDDMRRVVEVELGFIATVCPDGTPNLSPKGTTAVWDEDHLVFADLRSPGTVDNLRANSSIEINAVDQLLRTGYRFKGTGTVYTDGDVFERGVRFYEGRGTVNARRENSRHRDRHRRESPADHLAAVRPRAHRRRGPCDQHPRAERAHCRVAIIVRSTPFSCGCEAVRRLARCLGPTVPHASSAPRCHACSMRSSTAAPWRRGFPRMA